MIGGIFLYWFVDSMLFSMMIKTEFDEPVKSIQDLIDREMSLGDNVELRDILRLCSHWSSSYITELSLVESVKVLKYFHSAVAPAHS